MYSIVQVQNIYLEYNEVYGGERREGDGGGGGRDVRKR
jgi:hypothetical protein